MEKKSIVDLYNEINEKNVKDFMFETADYINQYCKTLGKSPLFKVDNESEILINLDQGKWIPYNLDEFLPEYDCNKLHDALSLVYYLKVYNLYQCNGLLFKGRGYRDYFLDFKHELIITTTPEDYLQYENITYMGKMPAFVIDDNVLFSVDPYLGTKTLNKIFSSPFECEEFIINYCKEKGYINFGTTNVEQIRGYYLNLIDTSNPHCEEDFKLIKKSKSNLELLDKYLLDKTKKQSGSENSYKGR